MRGVRHAPRCRLLGARIDPDGALGEARPAVGLAAGRFLDEFRRDGAEVDQDLAEHAVVAE